MEAHQILDYISHENADHSKHKYTKVTYYDGKEVTLHLFGEDQPSIKKSLSNNLWTFRTMHGELYEMKGSDIESLKSVL